MCCFNNLGDKEENVIIDWLICYWVVFGVVWGFVYFYYGCDFCIIYGDVSFINIFFDIDFEFYFLDFGLVKLLMMNDFYVIVIVGGIFGYVVLEFVKLGWVIEKVDVYSYGVILFEFLSG